MRAGRTRLNRFVPRACQNFPPAVEWKARDEPGCGYPMPSPKKKSRRPANRTRATASPISRKSERRTSAARKSEKLTAGEWFEKLVAVQKRLRAPRGCPWDREQTHATLRTYLIEEAYEVLDDLD